MEHRGLCCPRGSIFLPSLPVEYFCPRISRQRMTRARKKPSKRVKLEPAGAELPRVQRQYRAGEVSEANMMYQAGIPTRAQQQRVESPWLALLCPCPAKEGLVDPFLQETEGRGLRIAVRGMGKEKAARSSLQATPSTATVLAGPLNCMGKLLGGPEQQVQNFFSSAGWEYNTEACLAPQLPSPLLMLPQSP